MDGGDAAMPMYFVNTFKTTLWFKSWETDTVWAYVLSLVGLVAFAVVHECIACYRSCFVRRLAQQGKQQQDEFGGGR